jgi:hypothetical protein
MASNERRRGSRESPRRIFRERWARNHQRSMPQRGSHRRNSRGSRIRVSIGEKDYPQGTGLVAGEGVAEGQ